MRASSYARVLRASASSVAASRVLQGLQALNGIRDFVKRLRHGLVVRSDGLVVLGSRLTVGRPQAAAFEDRQMNGGSDAAHVRAIVREFLQARATRSR